MIKTNKFYIYKIYYKEGLVYIGRTEQELVDRIRLHVFKNTKVKAVDIDSITKIEYAELNSEADMYLYEIYYICKFKPSINRDDKPLDELSLSLPEIEFHEWKYRDWDRWKKEVNNKNAMIRKKNLKIKKKEYEWGSKKFDAIKKKEKGEMSVGEYENLLKEIETDKIKFKYSIGEISFDEYCNALNLHTL